MNTKKNFMNIERITPKKESPQSRIGHFDEFVIPLKKETVELQASRCMSCGVPFCHSGVTLAGMVSGCPLNNLIPEWNNLIANKKYSEAYQRLTKTNPFPEFTSRVCPAPCEGACTNGIHYQPVTIKNIEYTIIEEAFKNNWVKPYTGVKHKEKVAVIGSGPAGLSAAHYLTEYGYNVFVYEKSDEIGGLLMYGIPSMKLNKDIIKRRVDVLESSGVTFFTNMELGSNLSMNDLRNSFDSVVLAIGTQTARDINVLGRNQQNIVFALDYLTDSIKNKTKNEPLHFDTKGLDVIVIGGGDTATDCVATSLRQSCNSVRQFEIMPKKPKKRTNNPWPEYPKTTKVDYGQIEATTVFGSDPRTFEVLLEKVIGEDSIDYVETSNIEWTKNEGSYQMNILDKKKQWDADMVIIAAGFIGPNQELLDKIGIKYSQKEYQNNDLYTTNYEDVFIVGDMRKGQSLVVSAMQEGKEVATNINTYFTEKKEALS